MRLTIAMGSLPDRLVAAAITLAAGLTLAAPGQACEKHTTAASAAGVKTASKCPMTGAAATATTADAKGGSCCGMSKDAATAAKANASCPMTAACPPSMCGKSGATSAATASMSSSACPHDAAGAGACERKSVKSSAASARKTAVKAKAKPARKPVAGATAAAVTPGTAGLVAVIDPETGGVGQATAGQLAGLAANSKPAGTATRSGRPNDVEIVALPGGGQMANLPERLMMNAVARRDAKGKVTFSCGNGATPAPAAPASEAPSTWEVK